MKIISTEGLYRDECGKKKEVEKEFLQGTGNNIKVIDLYSIPLWGRRKV